MNNEIFIQITSGRGPAECCWVVSQVLKILLEDAADKKITAEIIQRNEALEPGTLVSALVKFNGIGVSKFVSTWQGIILWIGQSPFRKLHKRKNWFIGINRIDQDKLFTWDENEITFQTLRSSGPGGQHVNKTDSAVRAIHIPTGTQVTASDCRSQLQNKKMAIERLKNKLAQWHMNELLKNEQAQWHQHNILKRGNPVRVFRGKDFVATAFQMLCFLFLLI